MSKCIATALFLVAVVASPAAAQPGGVTEGFPLGTIYGQADAPLGETDTTIHGRPEFMAPNGVNNLAYNWWIYRVAGDPVQRPFGTYTKSDGFTITGTSSYPHPPETSGPTATYNWTELGPNGTRFTAVYTTTVSGVQNSTTQAHLAQTFQITNPNPTALDIVLFNEAQLTPGGIASGTIGATGDVNSIDATNGAYNLTFSAIGASNYQVTLPSTNFPNLYGSPAMDLNNTGLPSSGTSFPQAAFEWSLTVPGNGSVTVSSSFDAFVAVPEPGTLFLLGFAAAAGALRSAASRQKPPTSGFPAYRHGAAYARAIRRGVWAAEESFLRCGSAQEAENL